jgi:S1-C subfamily serine protease
LLSNQPQLILQFDDGESLMRGLWTLMLVLLTGLSLTTAARADDVDASQRSVVRVVTVAIVNGEVVGFGHGSGFAVSPNRIVTNAHVVGDAQEYPDNVAIGIVPSEGSRSYPGRLVAIDRRRDLALVEIVRGTVPAASVFMGALPQRETVFALGYPGNVDLATAQSAEDFIRPQTPVASDGIISSLQDFNGVAALVHDADIARGNSGGPLVDRCGRVVGVNSAITRADEGDSPFSFAIASRELSNFLREARQQFTSVTGNCVTQAEAAARDAAARTAAEQARTTAEARDTAVRAERLAQLQAEAETARETYIALSALLFGGGVLSLMGAMMFMMQTNTRFARMAGIAGGVLVLGAIIVFLVRPDPSTVDLNNGAAAGAADDGATNQIRPAIIGDLSCRVDRSQSRLTVSAGNDAQLAITDTGCVNGRTQYADGADGRWTRTLVPTDDATVSRLSYDPASGEYVVERWLLSLAAMQQVRGIGGPQTRNGCTTDAAARTTIAARETALAAQLTQAPNERIIHRCSVRGGTRAP